MKDLKSMLKMADESVLDELIGKCEAKMASPFKKEKEVTVIAEAEPEESSEMGEGAEGIDPEDLQKLIQMYQEMKG